VRAAPSTSWQFVNYSAVAIRLKGIGVESMQQRSECQVNGMLRPGKNYINNLLYKRKS